MTFNRTAALVAAGLLLAVPAHAQGTAGGPAAVPGSAATAPAGKPAMPSAERTAKSKDCSMQADRKGLHGKARKTFRNACKHGRS